MARNPPTLYWRGSCEPLTVGGVASVLGSQPRWELEIGFGKGRHLLRSASARPESGYLGIEVAGEYFRMASARARRRELDNLALMRGDARQLLCAYLPPQFAEAVHVYFPDPWPKSRHHKRRLLDPETIDLVLGALRQGGRLYVATDHQEYGESLADALGGHPQVTVERLPTPWPDGARTNYEQKYIDEGREILRLVAVLSPMGQDRVALHPDGAARVVGAE